MYFENFATNLVSLTSSIIDHFWDFVGKCRKYYIWL